MSEASLRVVAHWPLAAPLAYWYQASCHALWHMQRLAEGRAARLRCYAHTAVPAAPSPARATEAAHDLAWYLARLSPLERARLLAMVLHCYPEYVGATGEKLNTVKVGNTHVRAKLRRFRAHEEREH